jgi:predicted PhzF superfamily epimerase YddE/YHI9
MTPFYLIDVFTTEPFSGNPLAVVSDADELSTELMRRIAGELNQTETTFVLTPTHPEADWRLRSFTAAGIEVFGVGHNALGAWWWLATSGRLTLDAPTRTFTQEIDGRALPVEVRSEQGRVTTVSMAQPDSVFGAVVAEVSPLAACLRSVGAQGCYLFCLDPLDPDAPAQARFFGPNVGIAEDPATGSAAGPLAAYLVARKVASERRPVIVEQGGAMGRPSRIEVRVSGGGVRVSGNAVPVVEGRLRL